MVPHDTYVNLTDHVNKTQTTQSAGTQHHRHCRHIVHVAHILPRHNVRGLVRQLPPLDNEQEQNAEVVEVERANTMAFAIDANGKLTLDAQPINMSQVRSRVAEFVGKRGEHHVISIDTDPAADYNTYFALENAIVGAYADVRDRIARKKYRTGYAQLSEAERQKVRKACPQHILETYRTSADAATTTAPAGADGTMQKGGNP